MSFHSTHPRMPSSRSFSDLQMLKPVPLHHVESTSLLPVNEDEKQIEADEARRDAQYRGSVNLLASILGTGLLVMPGACKASGLIPFFIGSSIAAYACHTTACFLVKTVKFLAPTGDAHTYAGLASHVFGSTGEKVVEIGLVFQQLGACVGYILVIGDIFSPLLFTYFHVHLSKDMIKALVLWGMMFPLTVGLKDLTSLSFASAIAVCAIILFSSTVIINGFVVTAFPELRVELLDHASDTNGPFALPHTLLGLFRSIPLVCFAYDMHFNVIPVHEDMKADILPPFTTFKVFQRASRNAFALSFGVTVLMGTSGYLTFLSETSSNILHNFHRHSYLSPVMNLVLAMFGVGLALAFPMIVWELRQVIFILTHTPLDENGKCANGVQFYTVTACIFVLVNILFILAGGDATVVFALVGSTVTPTLDYIFPSLLYIKSGAASRGQANVGPYVMLMFGTGLVLVGFSVWLMDRLGIADPL